jgi:hypothetical protein
VVVLLLKKGDRNKCDSYREINLRNSSYTIYANIIMHKRLGYNEDRRVEERSVFKKRTLVQKCFFLTTFK